MGGWVGGFTLRGLKESSPSYRGWEGKWVGGWVGGEIEEEEEEEKEGEEEVGGWVGGWFTLRGLEESLPSYRGCQNSVVIQPSTASMATRPVRRGWVGGWLSYELLPLYGLGRWRKSKRFE